MEPSIEELATLADDKPPIFKKQIEPLWDFKASHWVTAILTIALVWVGSLQYRVYSRQAGIMDVQARIAGSQARPWVGLSSVLIGSINRGAKLSLSAQIRNSGGTPALKMTVCAASDTPNVHQIDVAGIKKMMKELEGCPNQAMFLLLPNAEIGMNVSRVPDLMTQTVIDDVATDRATFAVFGRITYQAASDGRTHWTTFCALYARASNSFNACAYGNETDENSESINLTSATSNVIATNSNAWVDPITIFTALLVVVGALQAFVYFRQKHIMEKALKAHRRPKVLIREMGLAHLGDNSLRIDCYFANAGDATATILGTFVDIQSTKIEKWISKPVVIDPGLQGQIIEAGATRGWTFQAPVGPGTLITLAYAEEVLAARNNPDPTSVSATLYVRGVVIYEDCMHVQRRTAFWRVLNARTYRFHALGLEDSDYEYAD